MQARHRFAQPSSTETTDHLNIPIQDVADTFKSLPIMLEEIYKAIQPEPARSWALTLLDPFNPEAQDTRIPSLKPVYTLTNTTFVELPTYSVREADDMIFQSIKMNMLQGSATMTALMSQSEATAMKQTVAVPIQAIIKQSDVVANLYTINNSKVTYYPMVIPFLTATTDDVDFSSRINFTQENNLAQTFSNVRVTAAGARIFKTSLS